MQDEKYEEKTAMSAKVTKNDIPNVDAIKQDLVGVLASGRSRSFAGIAGDVAKELDLTREQRSYRIGKSNATLFESRLVQARIELTKEGVITYRAGKVKLVKRDEARLGGRAVHKEDGPEIAADQTTTLSEANDDSAASGKTYVSKAPEGRPTKCLSFQEPFASYIVTGVKDAEFRSKKVNVPICNLVVCASKTPRFYDNIPGLAYGLAIGMVDVVECIWTGVEHAWKLENPRLIKPFEVHATAGFFYVSDIPEVIPNDEESYREHILPHCFRGTEEEEDAILFSIFSAEPDVNQVDLGLDEEKFDLVKARLM